MDASAIVQNDASIENLRALTEATLEHGIYTRGHAPPAPDPKPPAPVLGRPTRTPPGAVDPWDRAQDRWPAIIGDPKVVTDIWAQTDGLAYMFAWQMLESF
jgi:hypothetical protein